MGFQGAVLIAPAIEPGMRTNAIAFKEDFNHIAGNPDINFLLDLFKWYRIFSGVHTNMVIILNIGNLPGRQFKWL